ncbi:hypothetical protein WMY93_033226 [Mugilogobius chulae]|uniref:Uncharacterized protein n=1 Tax=Mugilogobius chulae TaxID=88201 RepID=A0AAW0MHQ5_9GOBI
MSDSRDGRAAPQQNVKPKLSHSNTGSSHPATRERSHARKRNLKSGGLAASTLFANAAEDETETNMEESADNVDAAKKLEDATASPETRKRRRNTSLRMTSTIPNVPSASARTTTTSRRPNCSHADTPFAWSVWRESTSLRDQSGHSPEAPATDAKNTVDTIQAQQGEAGAKVAAADKSDKVKSVSVEKPTHPEAQVVDVDLEQGEEPRTVVDVGRPPSRVRGRLRRLFRSDRCYYVVVVTVITITVILMLIGILAFAIVPNVMVHPRPTSGNSTHGGHSHEDQSP